MPGYHRQAFGHPQRHALLRPLGPSAPTAQERFGLRGKKPEAQSQSNLIPAAARNLLDCSRARFANNARCSSPFVLDLKEPGLLCRPAETTGFWTQDIPSLASSSDMKDAWSTLPALLLVQGLAT